MKSISLAIAWAPSVFAANSSILRVPYEYTYLLPQPFNGTVSSQSWLNNTNVTDAAVNSKLRSAGEARFVSYSDEFSTLLGNVAEPSSINCPQGSPRCAFEAAVWVPGLNEVWFTTETYAFPNNTAVSRFYLSNGTSQSFNVSGLGSSGFNGGTYFRNKVWLGGLQAPSSQAAIVSIDPSTMTGTPIINSYLGLPFYGADDLVWVKRGNDAYLFFTGIDFSGFDIARLSNPLPLPNAVWRWDPQESILRPVIDRTQINVPNGIKVSPDQRTLYVSDTLPLNKTTGGTGNGNTATNAMYTFELGEDALPGVKKMFSFTRTGVADGIHIDDKGRVWTGEGDAIYCRSAKGRLLGQVNTQNIAKPDDTAIAQFSFAGDKLVIPALDHVLIYQLNETLVAPDSIIVN